MGGGGERERERGGGGEREREKLRQLLIYIYIIVCVSHVVLVNCRYELSESPKSHAALKCFVHEGVEDLVTKEKKSYYKSTSRNYSAFFT